jgi:ABC-type lipoprotein release transport system permease subunit
MIWSVAWRNIWRNKVRSGVVLTAIALGIFAGVFSMAFMRGIADQRLRSAIMTEISHIQIHTPEFTNVNDIQNYFKNSTEIVESTESLEGVKSAAPRIIVNAIVNSAEKGGGVKLVGVKPEKEKAVSNLEENIISGNYLDPLKRSKPILIGKELAEKLGVENGSKIVAGIVNSEGTPMYYQFRIGGIFDVVSSPFEESTAFVRYSDLIDITGLPSESAHEIAVLLDDRSLSGQVSTKMEEMLPNLKVQQWNEIMPELNYLTESMNLYMYIFILIILLALGFGIVNTMLMVVLERVKELGMLMAVGMNKVRIFSMILLETVFLCLTGGILGVIIGSAVSMYFGSEGLDLSGLYGEGFKSMGYDSVIFTTVNIDMIVITVGLVFITGVLSSVYPAIKALRLNPSDAIRTDA